MDNDSAVVVVDFVSDDELFPYKPSERLRKDITAALTLRAYPIRKTTTNGGLQHRDTRDEAVIVLTRTYFGRLHKSEILRSAAAA